MTLKFLLALILTTTLGPPVRYVFYKAKLLPDDQVYQGGSAINLERTGASIVCPGHSPARASVRPSRLWSLLAGKTSTQSQLI